MKHPKPTQNQKIGHWTIIDPTVNKIKGSYYVICRCVCGKEASRNYHSLLSGGSSSCGCKREISLAGIEEWKRLNGGPNKKAKGEAAFNELFCRYKYSAKKKGHEFNLSKDDFRNITKMNCYYCNTAPSKSLKNPVLNGEYVYNGIDRKNNKEGYTAENSLPCCHDCNFLKRDIEYQEFITLVKKISEHLK